MKKTIETVVLFSMYMIDEKKSNLEDIAAKIVCVIGAEEILNAYQVSIGYESKALFSIKQNLARNIILDLLQKNLK
jgi:hypothetical protein